MMNVANRSIKALQQVISKTGNKEEFITENFPTLRFVCLVALQLVDHDGD
jgi:hypothetical protein